MFKELFLVILLVTLAVDLIFFDSLLVATKDKPPDLSSSTAAFTSPLQEIETSELQLVSSPSTSGALNESKRRLFQRSSRLFAGELLGLGQSTTNSQVAQFLENKRSGDETQAPEVLNVSARASGQSFSSPSQLPPPERPNGERVEKKSDVVVNGFPLNLSENNHYFSKSERQHINDLMNESSNKLSTTEIDSSNKDHDSTATQMRRIRIGVKSSKNHVLVSVDGIVIHESRNSEAPSIKQVKRKKKQRQNELVGSSGGSGSTEEEPGSSEGRGVHVVVLSQFDGRVMSRRVFDTYTPSQDLELALYLNMIHDGRLLVLAVKDEASFKMAQSSPARQLMQKLGSKLIGSLQWRDMWAFVVRKSSLIESDLKVGESLASKVNSLSKDTNLAEGLSKSSKFHDWAQPVILNVSVELSGAQLAQEQLLKCDAIWGSLDTQTELQRRRNFCSKLEGYGTVCDCSQLPAPISFHKQTKLTADLQPNWQLAQVPVIVIASNRPYYLQRMLRSLLQVDGIRQEMILVLIDGFYDEPLEVAQLFGLKALQMQPKGLRSGRISHHYKASLTQTFDLFPEAQFAIIFEEDLDVSRDALLYFNQTLPILARDPTLYCISAWNDQGYEHTASDRKQVKRIETMPGLGWMLSRKLYKEQLEPNWPPCDQPHDWDMWIRTDQVRQDRECLIPDVSRTFHFGASGTNINAYFQRQYFSKHAFSLEPLQVGEQFSSLQKLAHSEYELEVEKLIREAQVVELDKKGANATEFLCSQGQQTKAHRSSFEATGSKIRDREEFRSSKENSLVIYVEMIDRRDFRNWLKLAKCWRIWDLDARGQHNSMWRLHLNGRQTFVVGAPASPYSMFKPERVKPISLL